MTNILTPQILYLTGLFTYSGLMALSIVWCGKSIAEWNDNKHPYMISAAIGSLASAIMFACLTLVVAEPHWLPEGALIPLTRIVAAISLIAFSHVTANLILPSRLKR